MLFRSINSEVQLREFTSLWIRLQDVALSVVDDQIEWTLNTKAQYTVASAYTIQFSAGFSPIDFSKLWKSKVQPKCKVFMWLWLRQRILTDDNLQLRGIDHRDNCIFCDQDQETATHMALNCTYARSVWHLLAQWTGQPILATQLQQFSSPVEWWLFMGSALSKDELMVAIYGVWHVWKERCRRVFQQTIATESQVLDFIRDDLLLLGTYLAGRRAVQVLVDPLEAIGGE